MHARELDGRLLRFGHRGWLWHNAYLLYDRETDSIWHHQTGWAMSGPLRGRALARYPTVLTTFGAWAAEFPRTRVLAKPRADRQDLERDTYALRNAGLSFGIGVDLPGAFRLYPFRDLDAAGGLVRETIDGVDIVVVRDAAARAAYAFVVPEGVGTLRLAAPDPDTGGPRVTAGASGTWSARSGRPVAADGPLLRRLHASQWEVHAWERQHPTGSRFRAEDVGVLPGGR